MTITIELNDLANLQNETTAVTLINQNSETIEGGFTTALNVTGDQMQGTLDMNSNQMLNLPQPATAQSPLRLTDLNSFVGGGTVSNIPPGGAIGDVLVKTSTANYVTGWSPNAAGVTAGTNIVLSGTSPVTINTNTSPIFNVVTASTVTAVVPAGTLSGTTLASNVVSTSIASVGTITTGTWNATAITATSLSGVTLANNILSSSLTSLGVVTNLTAGAATLTGSLTATGNVTASGFISSIAQVTVNGGNVVLNPTGNITAIGTLTTSGNITSVTGAVSGASGSFTTLTTADASVWSATGLTNSTVLYSFTSPGGFNIYGGTTNVGATFNNFGGNNGTFTHQTASGSLASPSTIGAGQNIGTFGWSGYNGTGFVNRARILGANAETGAWTGTSSGAYIEFDTTASGSVSRLQSMRLMSGAIVGAGTVDPGANNLVVGGNITATGNITGVTGNLTTITSSGVISSSGKITALTGGTTVAGGNATAGLALGTLGIGIYFGSGAPSITAATGSIYLRTDGTTLTGRMYINTTGASTWTAVSTVG